MKRVYQAGIYLRLSKEEGRKGMSIPNQRDLLRQYVSEKEDIVLFDEYIDHGYSGGNFQRPGFQALLEAVKLGQVDCVLVKDLSRLGRNFLECERYLQEIFPFFGVRFISVNDGLDSAGKNQANKMLLQPMKNLMNDAYLGDLSLKIRSQLDIKRKNGEYISPHAPYGYVKGVNKTLEVDSGVQSSIRWIFQQKIWGQSCGQIAENLTDLGVFTPQQRKNQLSTRDIDHISQKNSGTWSATAVSRLLQNPVYMGTLVQGKTRKISHKTKAVRANPPEKQVIIPHHHPKIISEESFLLVQRSFAQDLRTAPGQGWVYPLAGLGFCGDCGGNLLRRNKNSKEKPHFIYQCASFKANFPCTRHEISVAQLESLVLQGLNQNFSPEDRGKLADLWKNAWNLQEITAETEILWQKCGEKQAKNRQKQAITQEKAQSGLISQEDCQLFLAYFQKEAEKLAKQGARLEAELHALAQGNTVAQRCYDKVELEGFTCLHRGMALALLEKIVVFQGQKVELHFRFSEPKTQVNT